jgi:transitional endoplasmic reticulum ATPase
MPDNDKPEPDRTPTWVKYAAAMLGAASAYAVFAQFWGPSTGTPRTTPASATTPAPPTPTPTSTPRSNVTFAQVGGHEDIKHQIDKRIIAPFREPKLFERFRKRVGGGVLMYGPPGCGKTLLARATAGQCGANFINVAVSDVLDCYIGESERKLTAIFAKARASAPTVLFFDELEGLAHSRSNRRDNYLTGLVSQFLTEMDGFADNNDGLLVLGATNVPWSIDAAFRRPGRFDRVLFIPPPDRVARVAILKIQLEGRPMAKDVDLAWIADHSGGFSGADLEQVVEEAVDAAIEASVATKREVPVQQKHLRSALERARSSTHEWFSTAREQAVKSNEGGQYDEMLNYLKINGSKPVGSP